MRRLTLFNILLSAITLFAGLYFSVGLLLIIFLISIFYFAFKYKHRYFLIYVILLPVIFISLNSNQSVYNEAYTHTATIVNVYASSIFVEDVYGNVYYLILGDTTGLVVGQEVTYTGYYQLIEEDGSFKMWTRAHGTEYYLYPDTFEVVNSPDNFRTNTYTNLLKSDSRYADYALAMLYKTETISNKYILEATTILGISHLFIVSGLHINMIIGIVMVSVGRVLNKNLSFFIAITIALLSLYLIYFPPSGVRALSFSIIAYLTSKYMSKIDALSLTGLIFFVVNPYLLFTTSLMMSFIATFLILFIVEAKTDNRVTAVTITLGAFLVMQPIVLTWSNSVNLLAPLYVVILSPLVKGIYTFLILLLPFEFLWPFGSKVLILFDMAIIVLVEFSIMATVETIEMWQSLLWITSIFLLTIATRWVPNRRFFYYNVIYLSIILVL